MWKLCLSKLTETFTFVDLSEFADQVDVELVGFGRLASFGFSDFSDLLSNV